MYKVLPLIIICVIALLSCANEKNNIKESQNRFSINQELIGEGVLEIVLPKERPRNLAIKNPKGEWFVLQDESESIEIIPQSVFDSIKILNLELKQLMGFVWRNGVKSKELVFKESGAYFVYFANNLETEPENTFSLQGSVIYQKSY